MTKKVSKKTYYVWWFDMETKEKDYAGVSFYNEFKGSYNIKLNFFPNSLYEVFAVGVKDNVSHYKLISYKLDKWGRPLESFKQGVGFLDPILGDIIIQAAPFKKTHFNFTWGITMKKYTCRINTGLIIRLLVVLSLFVILILISESSFSYVVRSGFERKMSHLQSKFTGVILPIMSVFGLAYAGILAAIGNEAAKSKITFCIIGSHCGVFITIYYRLDSRNFRMMESLKSSVVHKHLDSKVKFFWDGAF